MTRTTHVKAHIRSANLSMSDLKRAESKIRMHYIDAFQDMQDYKDDPKHPAFQRALTRAETYRHALALYDARGASWESFDALAKKYGVSKAIGEALYAR